MCLADSSKYVKITIIFIGRINLYPVLDVKTRIQGRTDREDTTVVTSGCTKAPSTVSTAADGLRRACGMGTGGVTIRPRGWARAQPSCSCDPTELKEEGKGCDHQAHWSSIDSRLPSDFMVLMASLIAVISSAWPFGHAMLYCSLVGITNATFRL